MEQYKAFQFRLYPTPEQATLINKTKPSDAAGLCSIISLASGMNRIKKPAKD